MMNGIQFQSVQTPNTLSSELRSVIRDNVLQFYVQGNGMDTQEEGITALYERLSQEDKLDGESNSIANQKKILERYCKDHGYTAIRHYDEDDGYSGTNFNRPGFQRMLADIKSGKIKRVIVKDMSRFGRDYLQVGMYTDVLFPEFGVHFIAVNDGVDSTRGENEFTAIRNVFNEMYARDTSKKIRATWQSKGKSGEHLTTIPPYGYIKDPEDKKKWIVDEEAAAEAKAQRGTGLQLKGQGGVVQLQFFQCVLQVRVLGTVGGIDAAEHHGLDLAVAGQSLGGGVAGQSDRVAHAGILHGLVLDYSLEYNMILQRYFEPQFISSL